jgi:UTP--glucose-1-phosphate uridylyltransferase
MILAAGLGTRMLPATKAVPKEMLPIVDRPLIQYAVEEAVAAGIEEVILVIGPDKAAICHHFGDGTRADALARSSKDPGLVERVSGPARLARFQFVTQDEPRGIAHAVACAREHVDGEPFALMFPDDIILGAESCLAQLLRAREGCGGTVIAVEKVPPSDVSQYGIVDPSGGGNPFPLRGVVEKPAVADAPSPYGIVGRYVLSETIFHHIDAIQPGANGELQLTDAIARQIASGEAVHAYEFDGVRHDTGRPLGYLVASVAAGLGRDDLGAALRERLGALLGDER